MYRKLARHPRVKAIGEIGLDYHYEDIPRDVQQHAFRLQMALAEELELPVVIHEREAHGDALTIIDEYPSVKGVFHCFSGSPELANELVRRGWYIGFTGVVTFKNARKAVETAKSIPLGRILIETDCPLWRRSRIEGGATTRAMCRWWRRRSRNCAASRQRPWRRPHGITHGSCSACNSPLLIFVPHCRGRCPHRPLQGASREGTFPVLLLHSKNIPSSEGDV